MNILLRHFLSGLREPVVLAFYGVGFLSLFLIWERKTADLISETQALWLSAGPLGLLLCILFCIHLRSFWEEWRKERKGQ